LGDDDLYERDSNPRFNKIKKPTHDFHNSQTHYSQRQQHPSLLQSALRYGLLSGLQSSGSSGGAFGGNGNKGFEYFMESYGPLAQVLTEDVMDTMGFTRNIKMAIPMVGKMLMLGMYLLMNFNYEMRSMQPTIKSAYKFLQHFNKPQTSVYNDVTDEVFTALDRQMDNGNYLY